MEDHAPLISIIVPVYNTARWLPRCLDSIQNQTFTDWECILSDDGSTDESGVICDEYAAKDPRFRVIHKENGGVSSARNAGLEAARGKYIQFVDSDDYVDTRLLAFALHLQTASPQAMVVWTWTSSEEEFASTLASPLTGLETSYAQQCWRQTLFVETYTRLFDAGFIAAHQLRFDTALGHAGSVGEDADFTRRYIQAAYGEKDFSVLLINEPVYFYVQENQESLMHRTRRQTVRQAQALPAPESNYLARLLEECSRLRTSFDAKADPSAVRLFTRHYLRCMAFGLWSVRQLGEKPPKGFFRRPEVTFVLDLAKEYRVFSAYYLPFRLHLAGLAALLYAWDEGQNINYWRLYEIFYRLFFRGWEK